MPCVERDVGLCGFLYLIGILGHLVAMKPLKGLLGVWYSWKNVEGWKKMEKINTKNIRSISTHKKKYHGVNRGTVYRTMQVYPQGSYQLGQLIAWLHTVYLQYPAL